MGTVFLKGSAQADGELLITTSNTSLNLEQAATTLRSVGRYRITSIDSLGAGRYRITANDAQWATPSVDTWELGLTELHVSLDADDLTAPLYTILSNDSNSFEVESATDLSALVADGVAPDLIGVIRLDYLEMSPGVRLVTGDRIEAVNFDIAQAKSVEQVAEFATERVDNLGDVVLVDQTTPLYGAVNVSSLSLRSSTLVAVGEINVTGNVSVEPGLHGIDTSEARSLGTSNAVGSVQYHYFTIRQDQDVFVSITNANTTMDAMVFRDDGGLSTDDFIAFINGPSESSETVSLAAGDYLVAVSRSSLSTSEVVNGRNFTHSSFNYSYTLNIQADPSASQLIGLGVVVGGDVDSTGALDFGVRDDIRVGGDVNLTGGGQFGVLPASGAAGILYALNLDVSGALVVDTDSSIDLDGQGYPANYHGPDFGTAFTNYGCHAGERVSSSQTCAYGHYEQAMHAGSGFGDPRWWLCQHSCAEHHT